MGGLDLGKRRADDNRETEGAWVNVADTPTGLLWWLDGEVTPVPEGQAIARLRIARQGNPKARAFYQKALKPYRRLMRQAGELPEKVSEKLLLQQTAHGILLDWENIEIGGEPVEYSVEAAENLLQDNEELHDLVLDVARTAQVFRADEIAEAQEILGN